MGISEWQNQKEWEYLDTDLFGQKPEKVGGGYLEWKLRNHYRVSKSEEKCKNCKHHLERRYNRTYHKCKLLGVSFCMSTDIRAGHVCDLYEKEEE